MGLLEAGETWLRSQRSANTAVVVSYARGATTNASVRATQARTEFDKDDGETIVKSQTVDWLIDRSDLTLSAVEITPQVGDKITRVYSHASETFIVAEVGSEDCWRWHGRDGGTFRIHTVKQ